MEAEVNAREQIYKKMLDLSRIPNQEVVVTIPIVINGLKFIAENQELSQEELIEGLLKLGCNFTLEEVERQFPGNGLLFEGISKGDLASGAYVITSARDNEIGRGYVNDRFLSVDDEFSIYHFIRITTGDQNYTKENLDLSKSSNGRSR